MPDLLDEQKSRLKAAGQEHVFRFLEELDEEAAGMFLHQVASTDIELATRLYSDLVDSGESGDPVPPAEEIEPPESISLPEGAPESLRTTEAWRTGEQILRDGKVACLMVAGGQGTRLGYDGPKGSFPIGPVSERTFFRIQSEKVLAAAQRYGCSIPFYVMVSHHNDEETRSFFRKHGFFGLREKDVFFFKQDALPAVDEEGRIILKEKNRLFLSPNGHGGTIKALKDSGALDDMQERGIEVVSYFQVDNPLVRAVDPWFIGLHIDRQSEMSLKALIKKDPFEKVGNVVSHKGITRIIEYSDLPDELAEMRDDEGKLLFRLGSIAIHAFSVDFLKETARRDLPFHVAHKKIPHLDKNGRRIEPEEPNGYKFEMFIFDALPFAGGTTVAQTSREMEFSPVKNAEGPSSPATCRRALSRFYVKMLKKAGLDVPAGAEDEWAVEISPLCGTDSLEFASWMQKNAREVVPADRLVLQPPQRV